MLTSQFAKNPVVGTRLTPALIRDINAAIRRNQPIAGKGVTITRTAGGTIINSTAKGGNTLAVSPKVDIGCFAIRQIPSIKGEDFITAWERYQRGEEIPEGEEIEMRDCLFNRNVWVGSQMYELPELEVGTERFNGRILCIEILSGSHAEFNYALTNDINEAAAKQGRIVIPLYSFLGGSVDVDYRNIPRADAWSVVV